MGSFFMQYLHLEVICHVLDLRDGRVLKITLPFFLILTDFLPSNTMF